MWELHIGGADGAALAAGFVFCALGAMSLWRLVRTRRGDINLASLIFAFTGMQTMTVMVSGLLGVFRGPVIGVASFVGCLALAAIPATRRRIGDCFRDFLMPLVRRVPMAVVSNPVLSLAWAVFSVFVVVRGAMFILLLPPTSFDTITYHMPKVAQWVQTGTLYLPDLPIKRVFWPSGSECLNAWWAVFPHNDLLVNIPGHFFWAVLALSSRALARNMGVGARLSNWCALATALTPVYAVHATTCLNDLPVAAGFLYLAALWSEKTADEESARTRLTLSVAVLCLTVGTKPTIAFLMPGLLLVAAFNVSKYDRDVILAPRRIHPGAFALIAAAAFLGSYWYLRNWCRFGNPLYPVILGSNTEDGIQSGALSCASLRGALGYLLAQGGILDGRPVIANLYQITGWGWFAVVCGIPASIGAALQSRRFALLMSAFLLSAATVLSAVVPDSTCLRFLLWFAPLPCIGFFLFVEKFHPAMPLRGALLALAVWTATLNMGSAVTNAAPIDWRKLRSYPRSMLSGLRPLSLRLYRNVPEDASVAVCLWREDPLYLIYGSKFTRRVLTVEHLDEGQGVADLLDALGTPYYFHPGWPSWNPEVSTALEKDLADGRMENLGLGLFKRRQP